MLGMELGEVDPSRARVRRPPEGGLGGALVAPPSPMRRRRAARRHTDAPARPFSIADLPNDPSTRLERDALQAMLQYPDAVGGDLLRHAVDSRFGNASLAVVRDGIASVLASPDPSIRVDRVVAEVPAPFAGVVHQLAVAPVPQRSEPELAAYVTGVVSALVDRELLRQKSELLGRLQRTDRGDVTTLRDTAARPRRARDRAPCAQGRLSGIRRRTRPRAPIGCVEGCRSVNIPPSARPTMQHPQRRVLGLGDTTTRRDPRAARFSPDRKR